MTADRFQAIAGRYPRLRAAVVGDFCLDRYLEIDPTKRETSLETGLPVHNVVNVRSQPGGAGTILSNLAALRLGTIFPVGFAGEDGEGYELRRALAVLPGVQLDHFLQTGLRRTFTYCKPLVLMPGKAPVELNRFDSKNWSPTPAMIQGGIVDAVQTLASAVDAIVLLDQVEVPETGVVTHKVLEFIQRVVQAQPGLLVIADSRRGLRGYPPVTFKMNRTELAALADDPRGLTLEAIKRSAATLARQHGRNVFVTLAECGILGAAPTGEVEHVPAWPVRGEIDVVGAGDAVTANLALSLAAGATLGESLAIANAAASVVIHQLGTTGTAAVEQISEVLTAS